MDLNVHQWKEFKLNDLFNITAGIYHYANEYEEGSTPYVSASNENNGIAQRINLSPDFKGNCIITGKVGCTAFYQLEDFCATSDVNVLIPKKFELNEKIGLFLVTIINKSENYKWSYGRQCRVGDSKEITIKLPILIDFETENPVVDKEKKFSSDGYIPDWNFMENYITSLNHNPPKTMRGGSESLTLGIEFWKEFCLGDLFSQIYKAEAYVKSDLPTINNYFKGALRFVSRTEMNNGCDCYVLNSEEYTGKENGNALIIGDTTATCFYQLEPFLCGDHIVVCRADWLNKYTAAFIKTVIKMDKYRYSYGRAFKMDLIKKTMIKLPVNNEGNPDWEFMEKYISELPYGDKI